MADLTPDQNQRALDIALLALSLAAGEHAQRLLTIAAAQLDDADRRGETIT